MKKLTAEEFAEKVMENGTEIDYSEWASKNRGCEVWEIYAHINENGEVVHGNGIGIESNWTYLELVCTVCVVLWKSAVCLVSRKLMRSWISAGTSWNP